jgi:glycosyltransferase involved in cell wall biosynthesis
MKKKIKILNVLSSLDYSGVEMMLATSNRYMKKENIKSFILSTSHKIGPAHNLLKKKDHQIKYISFSGHKLFRPIIRFFSFFTLLNFLIKNKFDIINIYTEANFFKISLCAILSGNRRVIRTINNVFFPSFVFHLRRKIIIKFCKLLNVKFITYSNSILKNELVNYNLKVKLLNTWYDERKFSYINYKTKEKLRKKYKISKNTLVLLSVGNCSIIKNHNLIFKSLSILPKNLDWIYLHVGAEDNNKSERKLAKQLNIYKKCKFIGAKYDFSNYGNISDIYIMPSLVEGLGIATIEAGAIGLIPILTRVPGNNDILKKVKGTIGINQTPKSLTQAILKIYIMKKKEKSKISFSIHQQMNLYWPEKNFYSWIKFYRSI